MEVVLPFNGNRLMKTFACKSGLKYHTAPPRSLRDWNRPQGDFDLGVVVSFGYFLPKSLLQTFSKGSLNVHPSLLPKYRGAAPLQHVLMNEETETGVSIIDLSPNSFDSGKILKQSKYAIPPNCEYQTLENDLAELGSNDLLDTIENLESYQKNAWAQDELLVTKAPKISVDTANINFLSPRSKILALQRAIGLAFPLHTTFRNKRIQLFGLKMASTAKQQVIEKLAITELGSGASMIEPGAIVYVKPNCIFAKCSDGWISIGKLKVAGKRDITPLNFYNGYQFKNFTEGFR